jgi:hypothetical protein
METIEMPRKHLKSYASFVALAAALAMFLAPGGSAEEKKKGPRIEGGESGLEFMNRFDLDKDGKISHEEWEAVKPGTVYREKHWPEYNINGDDYITFEEVPEKDGESEPAPAEDTPKGPKAGQVAFVVKFDKDQDGKLSRDEFTGSYFEVYDRNGDGFIEPEEAPQAQMGY